MATVRVIGQALIRRHILTSSTASSLLCSSFHNTPIVKQGTLHSSKKSVVKHDNNHTEDKVQTTFVEQVKETTKSSLYLAVILAGLGVTGYIMYEILKELLSGNTPTGMYARALNRCLKDTRVLDALGEPIKAYGDTNRRGRRHHVRPIYYMQDGVKHMRMKFHIQGTRKQASVYFEAKEVQGGDYEYTYLAVLVDDVLGNVIELENKRTKKEDYFFGQQE